MSLPDMRTLMLSQAISYALYTGVIALLWILYRRRFAGLGLWLLNFVMQTMSMLLLVPRGVVPAWMAIVGSDALSVGGVILLYIGLERFVDRRSKPFYNGVVLVIFVALQAYFAVVHPHLAAHIINLSVAFLIIFSQCAWLVLHRAGAKMVPITKWSGWVFLGYGVVSVARIIVSVAIPPGDASSSAPGSFDVLWLLAYQVLGFALMSSLFLMVKRTLLLELQIQQVALKENEAQYRQIIELSPDAIIVHRDSMIVFVNAAAVTLLGATGPDDLLGKSIVEFVCPGHRAVVKKRLHDTLTQDELAILFGEKFIRLDGTVIDIDTTTARLAYQGQPALQTVARDVTKRKRAEDVIRLRLRLLEYAADHSLFELMQRALDEIEVLTRSPIGFYHFVEADQKRLSLQAWSTRTLQEFCKTEGRGMHYDIDQAGVWVDCVRERRPIIHNDYAVLPHRKGLPAGHAEVRRELVVPTISDGRIVAILGIGNKPVDYDEKDVELVTYVADVIWSIIERKRNEEQLRNYQRQLEVRNSELRKLTLAIEQSGSIIVITDTTGAIEYVNPRFEEITGYMAHEVLGENPRILKSGKQSRDFYRHLWETITGGQIWHGELHNKRKDGTLYWESATIAPVLDTEGHVTNFIAIKDDVTERKEAGEALRHSAEQLAVQNAELDAFAHTVAHDLKNPLGVIIGYAKLLEQDYVTLPMEDIQYALQGIVRSGEKLNTIIEELLLLAGVRKAEVVPTPLAMGEIVQEACDRLQLLIQQTQAHISVPEPSAWPVALGYAPWVEEVWANYISNALKYGGKQPRVELGYTRLGRGLSNSDSSSQLFSTVSHAQQRTIVFWVRDNGPGLTPEAQAKLFTPFTRLGQVRAQGHGLGLSIVWRIVKKFGGEVGVESAPGQGSRFYFTLPAAPVPSAPFDDV